MGLSRRKEDAGVAAGSGGHDLGLPYWPTEFSDAGPKKSSAGLMYPTSDDNARWIREADWSFVNGADNGAKKYHD